MKRENNCIIAINNLISFYIFATCFSNSMKSTLNFSSI